MRERRNPRYLWPLLALVMFGALLYSFALSKLIAPVGDAIITAVQDRGRPPASNQRAVASQARGASTAHVASKADQKLHPATD